MLSLVGQGRVCVCVMDRHAGRSLRYWNFCVSGYEVELSVVQYSILLL